MLNKDLFRLKLGLEAVGELTGIDFAYAVAKNLQVITAEVEAILKTKVPKKNYQEYDAARIALCEEHCLRDDKDNPKTENGNYVMKGQAVFLRALDELKESHREALAERTDQIAEYNEFIEREAKIELFMISKKLLPPEIKTGQLTAIIEIVQEAP